MKRNFAYKFRIYPTQEQEVLINKTFGCVRYTYNQLLANAKKEYAETKKFHVGNYKSVQNESTPWIKEVDSLALSNAYMNLKSAYSACFREYKKGKRLNLPVFHSKKGKQTFTTNNVGEKGNSIRIENGKLRLPKLGLIKCVFSRYVDGKIKSATVSKTKTGKYFVSILVELKQPRITESEVHNNVLGIDMAFGDKFGVFSDGRITNFPNYYKKSLSRIAFLNKKLAKKKKNSKNREKARLKLARVYEKSTNQLNNWIENLTIDIARNYDIVVVEDINLQSMSKMGFGKSVLNNGFGKFRTRLECKMKENLKEFVKANKWFPSSQICNNCGFRNPITKDLRVREYVCPHCGKHIFRDINASENLAKYCTAATVGSACGGKCQTCKLDFCLICEQFPTKQEKLLHKKQQAQSSVVME